MYLQIISVSQTRSRSPPVISVQHKDRKEEEAAPEALPKGNSRPHPVRHISFTDEILKPYLFNML